MYFLLPHVFCFTMCIVMFVITFIFFVTSRVLFYCVCIVMFVIITCIFFVTSCVLFYYVCIVMFVIIIFIFFVTSCIVLLCVYCYVCDNNLCFFLLPHVYCFTMCVLLRL